MMQHNFEVGAPPGENTLVFRLNDGQGPELLRQVFLERGWTEFEEDEFEDWDWNLWWRTSRFRVCDYDKVYPWQRLNHFPKSTAITKKDSLARNMKRMKGVYGQSVFNFSPTAFNLPNDYTKFVSQYSKSKEKPQYWICKPADLSRGRGIFLFSDLSELQYDYNAVVQSYISNPMLIAGYKFDLRIYVMVLSFQPLKIYIYQEGLVRFSTEKFDLTKLGNMYAHLTNTSINKHSPAYATDKERIGPGCKWTITQLRHYLLQTLKIDDSMLWGRVINIVILTILIQASQVPKAVNCFELYGFDILIDDNFKPWLLEVNFSPALGIDCQADVIVKKPMLHDLAEILSFTDSDLYRGEGIKELNNPRRMNPLQSNFRGRNSGRATSKSMRGSPLSRRPPSKYHIVPNIPKVSSMSNLSTVSWQSSLHEEGEDDSQSDVVPIIPGCGLPSVQQPPQANSSCSSGRSTGSPVSNIDFKDVYPRIPAIRLDNKPNSGTSIKVRNASSNNAKSGQQVQKRGSRISTYSDSAISSYSGSSASSEHVNGDHKSIDALRKEHSASGNHGKKHGPLPKALPSRMNKLSHGSTSSVSLRTKTPADRNQSKTPLGKSSTSMVHLHEHGSEFSGPSSTKLDNSLTPAKRRYTHQSFTGSTNRPTTYKIQSNDHSTSSKATATQQKLNSYAKPWKGRGVHPSDTHDRSGGEQLSQPRVGDFILVFPFNETTRKCAHSPEVGTAIKECQKFLRRRMDAFKEIEAGKDNAEPLLWGPLSNADYSQTSHSCS